MRSINLGPNRERERGHISLALARVKYEMLVQLERAGFIDRIGPEMVFDTLPMAVVAYTDHYTAVHGAPPPGVSPPEPPEQPKID